MTGAGRSRLALGRPWPFRLPPPMRRALDLAAVAAEAGEVPVGAVITLGDEIIAEARNAMRGNLDPTAHAEMVAIRHAATRLGQSAAGRLHIVGDAGAVRDVRRRRSRLSRIDALRFARGGSQGRRSDQRRRDSSRSRPAITGRRCWAGLGRKRRPPSFAASSKPAVHDANTRKVRCNRLWSRCHVDPNLPRIQFDGMDSILSP